MDLMSKRKGNKPNKQYPSRQNQRYVQIPLAWWEALKRMKADNVFGEDRSVSWLGKRAIRKFLEEHGYLPGTAKDED